MSDVKNANIPANNTAGSISSSLPQRREIVKTAKPIAEKTATRFPATLPIVKPSHNIITIPRTAKPIKIQVAFLTDSPRNIRPKTAAKKGAVANKNTALATVVD